jgi:hypothetical protein
MFGAGNYNAAGSERRDCDFLTLTNTVTRSGAVTGIWADTDTDWSGRRTNFIPEEFGIYTLIYRWFE